MFEIKITIAAPELAGALNNLADAMRFSGTGVYAIEDPGTLAEGHVVQKAEPIPAPVPAVQPAPAPAPAVQPAPAPTPAVQPAPAPAPVVDQATTPAPAPAQTPAPAPEAKPVDLNAIARAGAGLIDAGKMPQIMELLKKYGVQAVTQLKPEQYNDFANDLRQLGAAI